MPETVVDTELTSYAGRAAVATHIQYDCAGASRRQSFDAAVNAWLSIRPQDAHVEACESVLVLLIEMRAADLATRH